MRMLLTGTCLVFFIVKLAPAIAQDTCSARCPNGTMSEVYNCSSNYIPMCLRGASTTSQPSGPSPEYLAFQRVRPRMIAVIEAMSNSLPFLDRESWMKNLPNSPDEYISQADQLHTALVAQSIAFQRQVDSYRTIEVLGKTAPQLVQQALAAQQDITRLSQKLQETQSYLSSYQTQIDKFHKASGELKARSAQFLARIKADQTAVMATFLVLLPLNKALMTDNAQIVEPLPQTDLPAPGGPVVELYRNGQPLYPTLSPPLLVARPDTSTQPVYSGVPALSGSLEDRAAQLEKDAQTTLSSFNARNQTMGESQPAEDAYENAGNRLMAAVKEQNSMVGKIFDTARLVDEARSTEEATINLLHSDEARFFTYAVQSVIWGNAKTYVLNQIKVELKMQDYFKRHTDIAQSPFLDIDEAHVLQYYGERRFNVMNLPDDIQTAAGLRQLHNNIMILLTHGEGYAQEASTLAARGSESEMQTFVGDIYAGMDADSKSLVHTNMSVINLPEPFASIATHYFTKSNP